MERRHPKRRIYFCQNEGHRAYHKFWMKLIRLKLTTINPKMGLPYQTHFFFFLFLSANSSENRGGPFVHGVRPLEEVGSSDNLHFIIDSPKGVIQVGNCCLLLRVNFSSPLVNQLLEEGDINCKLHVCWSLLKNGSDVL